jgi:hypothetical protein
MHIHWLSSALITKHRVALRNMIRFGGLAADPFALRAAFRSENLKQRTFALNAWSPWPGTELNRFSC